MSDDLIPMGNCPMCQHAEPGKCDVCGGSGKLPILTPEAIAEAVAEAPREEGGGDALQALREVVSNLEEGEITQHDIDTLQFTVANALAATQSPTPVDQGPVNRELVAAATEFVDLIEQLLNSFANLCDEPSEKDVHGALSRVKLAVMEVERPAATQENPSLDQGANELLRELCQAISVYRGIKELDEPDPEALTLAKAEKEAVYAKALAFFGFTVIPDYPPVATQSPDPDQQGAAVGSCDACGKRVPLDQLFDVAYGEQGNNFGDGSFCGECADA